MIINVPSKPSTQPEQKKASGCSGCLKALMAFAAIIVFSGIVIGFLFWQSYNWVDANTETVAVQYPGLNLIPSEDAEASRLLQLLVVAGDTGAEFDERVTPKMFNAVLLKIREAEGKNNLPPKVGEPQALFLSFAENGYAVKLTIPVQPKKPGVPAFLNAEIFFNLDIENGKFKEIEVKDVKLHGQSAPMVARLFMKQEIDKLYQRQETPENPLAAIKLLRRENDKIHLILDGRKLKEQEAKKILNRPQPEADTAREF